MKEKLKKLLEKIGVLKIVWFFRYNFTKNVRRLIGRIKRKIENIGHCVFLIHQNTRNMQSFRWRKTKLFL